MQHPEQPKPLYRSGAFMAGLMLILTCFLIGVFWAWTRPRMPVGHVPPDPTPNPNERVEYLEGGIMLRIPITLTPDTSKKTPPAGAEKKRH